LKRRIRLVGTAVTAGSLAVLVVLAPVASAKSRKLTHHPNSVVVSCKSWVADQVPWGQTEVVPPLSQGSEYGPISCHKPLYFGVEADSFAVQDSGDITGTTVWYLAAGTIRTSFDLTPGSEDGLSFNSGNYTGKLTVTGGSEAYAGVTGSGISTCTTEDGGIHTSCTDNITVNWPASKAKRA
jgi:hypothetical protein